MNLPVIDFIGMFLHVLGFFSRLLTTEGIQFDNTLAVGVWGLAVGFWEATLKTALPWYHGAADIIFTALLIRYRTYQDDYPQVSALFSPEVAGWILRSSAREVSAKMGGTTPMTTFRSLPLQNREFLWQP
jgi:hypothetical protein